MSMVKKQELNEKQKRILEILEVKELNKESNNVMDLLYIKDLSYADLKKLADEDLIDLELDSSSCYLTEFLSFMERYPQLNVCIDGYIQGTLDNFADIRIKSITIDYDKEDKEVVNIIVDFIEFTKNHYDFNVSLDILYAEW